MPDLCFTIAAAIVNTSAFINFYEEAKYYRAPNPSLNWGEFLIPCETKFLNGLGKKIAVFRQYI